MTEKEKISETESGKSLLVLLLVILGVGMICFASFPVFGFMAASWLDEFHERPIIENIVREQCNLPDYQANGIFDSLDRSYFDFDNDNGEATISCSGVEWQCSCGEE